NQISLLKKQQQALGDLTTQIASGKKTQTLSGLGNDITKSMRARAGVNSLEVYIENIKHADRRLKLMQTSIAEIKAQVNNIADGINTAVQQGDYPDFESMQL